MKSPRRWITVTAVIGLIALVGTLAVLAVQSRPMANHSFTKSGDVLVIAHRGGRGLWPENTLFAFERAVKLGVDVIEFDVHLTKDHQLVILHDATLERTTDGVGNVEEMNYFDLSRLDAGYRWTADKGQSYPFRGQGIRLTKLEEVLTAFPETRMNIELKTEGRTAADQFGGALRQFQCGARVLVASFHPETIDWIRSVYPQLAFAASTWHAANFLIMNLLRIDFAFSPAANAFQIPPNVGPIPVVTPYFVQQAHHHNVDVHAWTINEKEEMLRLVNAGVDGIHTDYPDRLLAVLGRAAPRNQEDR